MGAAMHYLLFNESHDLGLTGQFCLLAGGAGYFQKTLHFQRLVERLGATLGCQLYHAVATSPGLTLLVIASEPGLAERLEDITDQALLFLARFN
jgi:hypothetical protein